MPAETGKEEFSYVIIGTNGENVKPARSSESKAINFRFSLSRQMETKETTTSMWWYVPIFEKMSEKIKINSPANQPKHSRAKWMSNERHEAASKKG